MGLQSTMPLTTFASRFQNFSRHSATSPSPLSRLLSTHLPSSSVQWRANQSHRIYLNLPGGLQTNFGSHESITPSPSMSIPASSMPLERGCMDPLRKGLDGPASVDPCGHKTPASQNRTIIEKSLTSSKPFSYYLPWNTHQVLGHHIV